MVWCLGYIFFNTQIGCRIYSTYVNVKKYYRAKSECITSPTFALLCLCSFQESVPPVMPFHLGSLGFLTPFNFDTYQSQVTQVIEGECIGMLQSCLILTGTDFICSNFTHFASLFLFSPGNFFVFVPFAAPFPSAKP